MAFTVFALRFFSKTFFQQDLCAFLGKQKFCFVLTKNKEGAFDN